MMKYPNSVALRVQEGPRRSGPGVVKPAPFPRRKPGRPVREAPRRPPGFRTFKVPTPAPVPAKAVAPVAPVVRNFVPHYGALRMVGRAHVLDMAVSAAVNAAIFYTVGTGDLIGVSDFDPAYWHETAPCPTAAPQFGSSAVWQAGGCLPGQWGVGDDGLFPHKHTHNRPQTAFSMTLGLWQRNPNGSASHHRSYYTDIWYEPGSGGWPQSISSAEMLEAGPKPIYDFGMGALPSVGRLPWEYSVNPQLMPIHVGGAVTPAPKPITNPVRVPEPLTPQMPDVGPRPVPRPVPVPATVPVPGILPGHVPYINWTPLPYQGTVTLQGPGVAARVNPRANPRARRPRPRTREKKARMGAVMAFMWNAAAHVTEWIDAVDILYESLPRYLKRREYQRRERQPNPIERALLVYQNINQLDVEKALNDWIKNDLEDRLYALGSDHAATANRANNRPIGYEAGGSLTGGGEYVPTRNTAPEWWPDFLPWSP